MSSEIIPGNDGLWLLLATELNIQTAINRPVQLNRIEAEQLVSHLAVDVKQHLPGAERLLLTAAGGFYDLCQLLRPGLPVFEAVNRLRQAHVSRQGFSPQILSFGQTGGSWPAPELQPDRNLPPGPMRYLPIHLSGPADALEGVAHRAEAELMDVGQVSAHTASWLQGALSLPLQHAHLLTFNDLQALWRLQLEQIGLLPLWELIDHQLFAGKGAATLNTQSEHGISLSADGRRVMAEFVTLDQLARQSDQAAEACVEHYLAWTRSLRQYQAGLSAHRITLEFNGDGLELQDHFAVEAVNGDSSSHGVAEFVDPAQGLIAVAVRGPNRAVNLYPLTPEGPNAIFNWLQSQSDDLPERTQQPLQLGPKRRLTATGTHG